jgi:hypothetical protein
MEREKIPALRGPKYLPELEQALAATRRAAAGAESATQAPARAVASKASAQGL